MVTDALGGVHPRALLERGESGEFLEKMSASLLRITRAFAPRPVVYRTIDFRTNEFRGLEGGDRFEPVEHNPLIGYRGCYRSVREPDLFALELELLARVREQTPNLHLMIPFVRTSWELEACLEAVDASPLDAGQPVGRSMRMTTTGAEDSDSNVVGLSILQADDMAHALTMVDKHHHFNWADGCEIEVLEEMPIPELGRPVHRERTCCTIW